MNILILVYNHSLNMLTF